MSLITQIRELRCLNCGKLLAELLTPPFRITCPRCKTLNEG